MMDSIPATEQLPWALCTAFKPVEEGPAGAAGAPYYQSTGWKKNKLKVHFMNEVPSGWRLTKEKVLEWANRWSDPRLKGIVPEFVIEEDIDQSDVRIMFSTPKVGSYSYVGTVAKNYEGEATMCLYLPTHPNGYNEHTVIHEFGHALGLGHEHQMEHLGDALDETATIDWLMTEHGMDRSSAENTFRGSYRPYPSDEPIEKGPKFDPWSVMCYPIALKCIKDNQRFTSEELEAITNDDFKQRTTLSPVDVISVQRIYQQV